MTVGSGGFDAPTKEDVLGRSAFAADVARIAVESPQDWSVRIGVYGRWGTGKTSVLLMVQELVESEDHRAVWFNPWGYDNIDAMWVGFVEAVFGALAEWGIEAPGSKVAALKSKSAKLVDFARSLMPMATPVLTAAKVSEPTTAVVTSAVETAASTATPFLDRWLRVGRDDLKGVIDALEGKRVVVLMDDVDRTDPLLLPRMFHAVKELLDLPGFSFVLALDPEVVSPALRRHHEGFGVEFLEKVIDFPKWLPEPSRDDLWKVAVRDLHTYCSFLDADIVRRVFHLLPSNPRRLRMFIRQLWSLAAQVERHSADELDQSALVLVHLLRVLWPKLATVVLASDQFLEQLAMMKFLGTRDPRSKETTGQIEALCKRVLGEESPDVNHAASVLRVVSDSWALLQPEQIRYLAHLTERPRAVTWKEFYAFLGAWDGTTQALDTWCSEHAATQAGAATRVRTELFNAAAMFIGHCCDRAADAAEDEAVLEWMGRAEQALALLGALWDLDLSLRTADAFSRTLGTFAKWMHFDNHDAYRIQRQREREFVRKMAQTAPPDEAARFYDLVVESALYDLPPLHRPQAEDLFAEVRSVLGPVVADQCAALFRSPQGIKQTIRDREARAEQSILFDGEGPLWRSRRPGTLQVLGEAAESSIVRQNVVDFLYAVTDKSAGHGGVGAATSAGVGALLSDAEVVTALWFAACSRAPNPRHLSSLVEVREVLTTKSGQELPQPSWWDRIAAEVHADLAPERTAGGGPEAEE